MMTLTRTCYGCKEKFRKDELIEYASDAATIAHWYCPKCLREKQEREMFSNTVCQIFGLKAPGPRIWRERKRLQDTYGYTDGVIVDCLDYIYNVKHLKKLSESLILVTPSMVSEMKRWKSSEEARAGGIIAAMTTPMEHIQVEIQENNTSNKKEINFDDYLMD